jgi:uncharacterized repeat protein (TIGR01451 family)
MISPMLGRLITCALIASALLFLMPDQLRDQLLTKNSNSSFLPFSRDKQNIDPITRTRIEQAYGKLPMRFEANQGQTDARVKFTARGAGYAVFLTGDEAVLQLRKRERASGKTAERQMADQAVESVALRMKLVGSNRSSQVSGIGKLQTTSNYFIGNDPAGWRRGVSNYSRVKYESVYPGIDLVWYGNQQLLEHDFLIAPGADPSRIKVSFSGAKEMSTDDEGALVLRAGDEDLRLLKPHAWQESEGSRRTIDCDYRLSEKDQVEFRLGEYDTTLPLVIDPVLVYSTYIGGIGTDFGQDIAVDGQGAAYIIGQTDSADFPGPSPIQPAIGTLMDAYVLKINPAGDAVVFGTWIGGNSTDTASAISVDPRGNIYLVGTTDSSDFPLQNPLQPSKGGLSDSFALKIDSSGAALLYSTYIGGTGIDGASALAVDGNGNVYLTGSTDSGDFPVANAFQPAKSGSGAYASDNGGESWGEIGNGLRGADVNDLVIAPGDPSTLYAGTDRGVFKSVDRGSTWNLLGGTQFIRYINQVIVDPSTPDILYAVSAPQLFKSTDGGASWVPKSIILRTMAIDPTTPSKLYAGTFDGISISTDGGDSWTPVFIPPVSGGTIGQVESIVFDPITPTTVYLGARGVYKSVDGGATWTFAGNNGFPQATIIRIAISRSNPATLYAISNNPTIFKSINAGANWSLLNTPAIGIFSPFPWPLVVSPDNPDVVYVGSRSSGIFRSNNGGVSWDTVNNGLNARDIRAIAIDPDSPARFYAGSESGDEAFVAKLDATGSSFLYSSYLGGGASDTGTSIVVDSSGTAYIAGFTTSVNFPVVNAFQATLAGAGDVFVARVNESGSALSWSTYLGGANFDSGSGIALSRTGDIYVAGITSSSDFPVNNAVQPSLNGFQDGFIARLKNDGSALDFSTYLGGTGFEIATAIAVDSAGNAYVTGLTGSLDFPVINAVQPTMGGTFANVDAFVTKLSPEGTSIVYSTYLGGGGFDQGSSIAVDGSANAYVTGFTSSIDFPTTPFLPRLTGPSDAFVTKIGMSADLAITLAGNRNPVMIKKQLTYTLTVTNNGPDPAVSTMVTDTPPAGVSLISAAASQGSCTCTSEINCELGSLASGGSAEITIIVKPSSAGTITNSASVTSGTSDPDPANNTAAIQTVVSLLPSIYGRVTTAGGTGVSGVTVAVDGSGRPPAMTSDEGNYQVSELAVGGRYTVTPSLQGYVFNPPSRTINNLQRDRRVDFRAVACNLSISPASQSFPAAGGRGRIKITSPDRHCAWTATSNVPWIKLISPPAGSGSANVRFIVEPTTVARGGTITINDTRITVFQEFNACSTVAYNTPKVLSLSGLEQFSTVANLIAEDFNNDSVSDLVLYVTQPVAGLSIALSNSADGYGAASMFYTGGVRTVRAGDLNNDGMSDLALITNDTPARLLILTGTGAGGFSAPVNIDTGPSPTALAIADFNSDGRSDLAVGTGPLTPPDPSQSNYNLAIHLGDGAGGFATPRNFGFTTSSGSSPAQIEAGDFNGDGTRDLVVMGSMGSAIIFTGDGSEGFTISRLNNVIRPGVMALGDFNGDLKTDLAVSQSEIFGATTLLIFISTTTGPLQHAQSLNISFEVLISAADFNGDGKSDLLLGGTGNIGVRYAISDGNFTRPVRYLPGATPGVTAVGDFKKDGRDSRTDLFVVLQPPLSTPFPTVDVGILTSDALGGFDAPRAFNYDPRTSPSPASSFDIESGDLNGDGAPDLAIAGNDITGAVLLFGDGRGEFGEPVTISTGPNARPLNIKLSDFNHDGNLDLAVLNSSPGTVVLLLGNGQGGFTQSATLNYGIITSSFEADDFNNDGNLDLVIKVESGGLGLFLGDGQGGLTPSTTGIGGDLLNVTFTSGDFDGDGNADLAYADNQRFFGPNLFVLFGDGQGGFGAPISVGPESSQTFLFAVDLNFDGRDDLVYSTSSSTSISVVLGSPGGAFAAPVQTQLGSSARRAITNDVNGDGKFDLITVGSADGSVSILLGNGDGSFNQHLSSRITQSPTALTTGDFDKNGRNDIAIVQISWPIVGILRNSSMCGSEGNAVTGR